MGPSWPGTTRARRGWLALVGGGWLALAACGDDGPHVRYRVVGLPKATAAGCGEVGAEGPAVSGATRARLTFRDVEDGVVGPLRCDIVLPLDGRAPLVSVPRRGDPVAMWVEYFDDAGTLLARGARRHVDLDGGDTVDIDAMVAGEFACARTQATMPRAFHSATLLPGGQVLLLGGLGASLTGEASFVADDGAYALATAELYDPVFGTSVAVRIDGLLPRAFHQTVVMGEAGGMVQLLVLGGHGVNGDPTLPGNVAVVPGGGGAPPWQPTGVDVARGRYGARGLPAEVLTYDPSTRSLTRAEVSAGPEERSEAAVSALTGAGGAVAMVGGRTGNGAASALVESVRPDGSVGGTASGRMRVGATATTMPDGTVMLVGGDLGPELASVRAVDRVSALDGTPSLEAGPSDTSSANRAYHAAAVLGADGLVAAGGLRLGGGGVEDAGPVSWAVRLGPGSLATTNVDVGDAAPAAYLDAVSLHDGSVLAAGGARPGGVCARTIECPAEAGVRFETDGGAAPVGPLGLPRYGHRFVRLPDGTVLVTGGLVADATVAGGLRMTSAVEQFEAHRASDDPLADLGLMRAPADVARDAGGAPLAECGRLGGGAAPVDAAVSPIDAVPDAP